MRNPKKTVATTQLTDASKGVQKHMSTNVTLGGTAYTPAELQGVFDGAAAAIEAADKARTQWLSSVKTMQALVAEALTVRRRLGQFLVGQYGEDRVLLGDFGLEVPAPPTPPTAATLAIAAVKAKATREARGIVSRKKRQALKGNVAVTIQAVPVVTVPAAAAGAPATTEGTAAK